MVSFLPSERCTKVLLEVGEVVDGVLSLFFGVRVFGRVVRCRFFFFVIFLLPLEVFGFVVDKMVNHAEENVIRIPRAVMDTTEEVDKPLRGELYESRIDPLNLF